MEKVWWVVGCLIVWLYGHTTQAGLRIPWEHLMDDVQKHGLVDRLVCEHTECIVSWKTDALDGFDSEYCTLKSRKRNVICRYFYENY